MITYPLNDIEYSAEDAELYLCTRSSGVHPELGFPISIADGNTVDIGKGIGWISNSEFSGKVVANKSAVTLDLGVPDAYYPRIDAVVIRFDALQNATSIVVKNGVAASSPIAPEVTRTESVYELHLYHIRREAGEAAISFGKITDLRPLPEYCGYMADAVTKVDTSKILENYKAMLADFESEVAKIVNADLAEAKANGMFDGYTPQKGIDYWTTADKTEIINSVLAELPRAEGVEF